MFLKDICRYKFLFSLVSIVVAINLCNFVLDLYMVEIYFKSKYIYIVNYKIMYTSTIKTMYNIKYKSRIKSREKGFLLSYHVYSISSILDLFL